MTPRIRSVAKWSAAALISVPMLVRAQDKKPEPTPQKPPATQPAHKPGQSPMSAEETLATFKLAPGLKATVWAEETGIVKPTNLDIDSKGRVWITEAANYRGSKTRPEGDRIMILEDTKHTGVCDSYKVFAQDPALFAPLGICVLGNKVIVAQSPNVLIYTIDASGDKPVGPPQVIFSGFGGTNHDHGVHAGVFGPDGRFYFNTGNAGYGGGYVKFGDAISQHDGKPLADVKGSEIGSKSEKFNGHPREKGEGYRDGMAFSMNLDGSDFDVLGYNFRNNYELTVDSFGTVWQSDNDDDGNQGVRINYVMEGGNFGYTGPTGSSWNRDMTQYKDAFPGQTKQEAHWHQRWPGVVPNLLNTGQGSPTGITVYEGTLLPEIYRGALLHCDPGPNVVRAYITKPGSEHPTTIMKPVSVEEAEAFKLKSDAKAGAGYEAVAVELIKGGDHWFRPDDICVGLDGALYVTDWYDPGVGGHQTGDTGTANHGKDWHLMHGRVYRLAPENYTYTAPPKLDLETVAGQVAALNSPNLATRYLGYTKLLEGINTAPVEAALKSEFDARGNKPARLRARALWLLSKSKDRKKFIEEGLKDRITDIRIAAFRAARRANLDVTQYADEILADKEPGLWRELAIALQYDQSEKVLPLIVKLADKYNGEDRWYLEAFGIATTGREKAVMEAWEKGHQNKDPKNNEGIVWRLKLEPVQLGGEPTTKPTTKEGHASAEGVAGPFADDNGVAAHDANHGVELLPAVVASKAAYQGVSGTFSSSFFFEPTDGVCEDYESHQMNSLIAAGGSPWIDSPNPWASAHGYQGNFTRNFKWSNPSVTLIGSCAAAEKPSAAATGPSTPTTAPIDFNKQFKTRDGKILPSMDALSKLIGDSKAGAAVFRNASGANCIKCHQIGDDGNMIGPPLTVIGGKLSKSQLYEAILYPSAAIEMGYETFVVKTKDGEVYAGLKVEDTPDHITIKDTDGKYHDIDPTKIQKMVKQSISLMPEGLNEALTQQDIVNLVEYLTSLKS